jgi:hypothetical protein
MIRTTAQRERPHRDYSVPSAGRNSGSPSRGELIVAERDDLGDRPAGDAQNVDRQRQVRALPLPPEVEGDRGLPVHGGGDGSQVLQVREAALDPVVTTASRPTYSPSVGGIEQRTSSRSMAPGFRSS